MSVPQFGDFSPRRGSFGAIVSLENASWGRGQLREMPVGGFEKIVRPRVKFFEHDPQLALFLIGTSPNGHFAQLALPPTDFSRNWNFLQLALPQLFANFFLCHWDFESPNCRYTNHYLLKITINNYIANQLENSELHCVNVNIISNKVCGDRYHYNGGIMKVLFCLLFNE